MKRLRLLVLVHEALVPPDTLDGYSEAEIAQWQTEYDVISNLRALGHDVEVLGVRYDLGVIRRALEEQKPHVAVNLLEEFHDSVLYDHHIASYLELMQQPYTGCNPRGLLLSHDKALTKKILSFHRVRVPRFAVFPRHRKPRLPARMQFPVIVKSLVEEGSYGISQASVVRTPEKCLERIGYLHEKLATPAIVEEYIDGHELYVSILGNRRAQVLPIVELHFGNLPSGSARIATSRVKWDVQFTTDRDIEAKLALDLDESLERRLKALGRRIYHMLDLSGYARIDVRVSDDQEIYVLEANANPDLADGGELSIAAEAAGIRYRQLLQRIVDLGLRYRSPARSG